MIVSTKLYGYRQFGILKYTFIGVYFTLVPTEVTMKFRSILIGCLVFVPMQVNATTITQIDLSFNGLDLTRFGGPIGSLHFQISVPDDSTDLSPESAYSGVFNVPFVISFGGAIENTTGWLNLTNDRLGTDQLSITVPFLSGAIPGTNINTALYGIELDLSDSATTMLSSKFPYDMDSDFANQVTSFSYYFRLDGWPAGMGHWHEFTSDSLNTASFNSVVTRVITPVPEPRSAVLMTLGIALLFTRLIRCPRGVGRAAPFCSLF